MKAFISILTGVAMALILYHAATQVDAENTVKPPPIEAPETTARDEIVTGMCTFGDYPVVTTTIVKESLTTENLTKQPQNLTNAESAGNKGFEEITECESPSTSQNEEITYQIEPVIERNGYIGTFWITGYTAEEGFYEGSPTASGYGVRPGYCALNADRRRSLGISYGDQIYVEGLGTYTVMDSGCNWDVVDIWVYTNAEAYTITGSYDVYLV